MKKRIIVIVFSFIFTLTLIGGASKTTQASSDLPDAIAVGTAGVGGVFYVLCVSLADIISRHTKMGASAQPVGGSDANMRAIKMGKVHVAMANTFSSGNAFRGKIQFAKEVYSLCRGI